MPGLLLARDRVVLDIGDGSPIVVCEPRDGVSTGWCAAIRANPHKPLGMWLREYLIATPADYDGREVNAYDDLPPGLFEAHSTLRSREAQTVYFEVTDFGTIEILGGLGDEDVVLARLNGLTVDDLHDLREAAFESDGLPALDGTFKQTEWAGSIRADLIRRAQQIGDRDLVHRLRTNRDASWFIANRTRTIEELRTRIPALPDATR